MTFQDKIEQLADRLCLGTRLGKVKWAETAEESSFRTTLHTGLVRVERYSTPLGQDETSLVDSFTYRLIILDDQNKEIFHYNPESLERQMTLKDLWEMACQSALHAEEKIDSLLKEIDNLVA